MLKPQLNNLSHHHSLAPVLLTQGKKNLIPGNGVVDNIGSPSSFLSLNTLTFPTKPRRSFCSRSHTRYSISQIKAGFSDSGSASLIRTISLKAVITVQMTVGGVLSNLSVDRAFDDIGDLLGKSLLLELVAAEADPKTGLPKATIPDYAHRSGQKADDLEYLAEFEVPEDFGSIGAIMIENEHHKEMFVESVVIEGLSTGPIRVSCNSWVHSKFDKPEKRVFFLDKVSN